MNTFNDHLRNAKQCLKEADRLTFINEETAKCFYFSAITEALLALASMMIPGGDYVQCEVFDPNEKDGGQADKPEEGEP